jgi:hypothetical protein
MLLSEYLCPSKIHVLKPNQQGEIWDMIKVGEAQPPQMRLVC